MCAVNTLSFLAGLWCQHSLNGGHYGSGWHSSLQEDVALILGSVSNHKRKVISAVTRGRRDGERKERSYIVSFSQQLSFKIHRNTAFIRIAFPRKHANRELFPS